MRIRIGTRQSPLALWQANFISSQLAALGVTVELVKITTTGDTTTTPLGQSGGVGLFTKEIQRALLDERCDVAVHSLKDLPTERVDGLELAAVPRREDPSDCLIATGSLTLSGLPKGAVVGTGSPRRRAQLLHVRPDLHVRDIRGNVDTRLAKLRSGAYDAIMLAYAGLHRLGLDSVISEKLPTTRMLPAVGQAALGLETRSEDTEVIQCVRKLNHAATCSSVRAERELLRQLRAGCLAPVAAYATCDSHVLKMACRVFSSDGATMLTADVHVPFDPARVLDSHVPEALAVQAMAQLREQGAEQLIESSRHAD